MILELFTHEIKRLDIRFGPHPFETFPGLLLVKVETLGTRETTLMSRDDDIPSLSVSVMYLFVRDTILFFI